MTLDEIFAKYDDLDRVGIPGEHVKFIEIEDTPGFVGAKTITARMPCGFFVWSLKHQMGGIDKVKKEYPENYEYLVNIIGIYRDDWELFHKHDAVQSDVGQSEVM